MNFSKKLVGTGFAIALACTSVLPTSAIETDYIDEKWGKPTVVYGGGLSEYQVEQTREIFKISNKENVYELSVNGNDLQKYLGYYGDTGSLISSVMVKKTEDTGVVVTILTTENILTITKEQYTNAAITAGVANCEIEVACISQATGESALTGVYKAFEANGETLDMERTEIAQEELQVTNGIANELDGSEGFDTDTFTQTMIDIKKELAELKQENGELSAEDIENLVYDIIERYNLKDLLTEENILKLIEFAKKYANSDAINSEEVIKQLDQLSKSLPKSIQDIYKKARDGGFIDRLIQLIKDFFASL